MTMAPPLESLEMGGRNASGEHKTPMKKPREKLRVESVKSQIPKAMREKLLMRRLSVDKSFLGLR